MMPDPERNTWGRIFPEDEISILYEPEDEADGGPEGEELDPAAPMPKDDHARRAEPGPKEVKVKRRKKASVKPAKTN